MGWNEHPEDRDDELLLAPWRRRLATLRFAAAQAPRSGAERRRRRAWLRLRVDESRRTGQLIVDAYRQEAGEGGAWGQPRPFALDRDSPEGFDDPADGELLGLLAATAPTLETQMRLAGRKALAVPRLEASRSVLPPMLHSGVLPRLCAAGRFVVAAEDAPEEDTKLAWDGGGPWTFVIAVERWGGKVAVSGRLRRGGESRRLDDARLVVDGAVVVDDASAGHTIAALEARGLQAWIWEFRERGDLVVSEAQLDALLDDLWNLPHLPPVEMPPEWPLEKITIAPRPRLVVHVPRFPRAERLEATLHFDYDGRVVPAQDGRARLVDRPRGRVLERDEEAEETAFDRMLELGARAPSRPAAGRHFEIEPVELSRLVFELLGDGWRVEAEGRRIRRGERVRFAVSSGIDWLELSGAADFEGASLVLPELLAAIRRDERLVRLGDGTYGVLPEEWLERYTPLAAFGSGDGGALAFEMGEAVLLDALLEGEAEVDADGRFARVRDRLRSFERIAPCREPPGFGGELRPYQREGLGWLRFLEDFGFGGCLADDMGLGKTVQVLALFELRRRREKGERRPSLVVVPASLVHNWVHEAGRFTPGLEVLAYGGPGRGVWLGELHRHDVVVTTYGTLRRDADELAEVTFDYVVLDEAQAIKNVASQTAKACRRLAARHRLALTGTPVENHLGELWSIFAFLNPGMTGRLPALAGFAGKARLDAASLELLGRALRPFLLRRTKEEVLDDLPEKTEQTLFCDLGEEQQELYDEMRRHYRLRLTRSIEEKGLESSQIEVLAALLRLRQAACHPGLLDEARRGAASAKLDVVLGHLEEVLAEGHKALVFSQFTRFLAILRNRLDALGIPYEYLDGATRDRQARVERFQGDGACPLFLISLKAGGVGLNLTAADYVFLLDPWWNPAVEAQAIDRAHRIGQKRPVFAYRLICRGTVEEKIVSLQEKKRELADAILTADARAIRALTAEDLRWLLT